MSAKLKTIWTTLKECLGVLKRFDQNRFGRPPKVTLKIHGDDGLFLKNG